jgi:hypothetical protein
MKLTIDNLVTTILNDINSNEKCPTNHFIDVGGLKLTDLTDTISLEKKAYKKVAEQIQYDEFYKLSVATILSLDKYKFNNIEVQTILHESGCDIFSLWEEEDDEPLQILLHMIEVRLLDHLRNSKTRKLASSMVYWIEKKKTP